MMEVREKFRLELWYLNLFVPLHPTAVRFQSVPYREGGDVLCVVCHVCVCVCLIFPRFKIILFVRDVRFSPPQNAVFSWALRPLPTYLPACLPAYLSMMDTVSEAVVIIHGQDLAGST